MTSQPEAARGHGFWITNHLANHFVRPLLRSRFGARAGRHLALIRVPGCRTGRIYELPVQYARDDGTVWIVPGHASEKTWWRNLRSPGRDIEIRLAGRDCRGHGTALERASAPDDVRGGVDVYSAALPRAAAAARDIPVIVRVTMSPGT